jgi:hypothetical protein
MGILSRLFGGPQAEQPKATGWGQWYDIPGGGYFEIAGVQHHKDNVARRFPPSRGEVQVYDDIPVTLHRDPRNRHDPNAVEVRLDNRLIGYIPRESAPAWSGYLARLEAAGYAARATARVRAGAVAYWIYLYADEDADYLMPAEEAERQEQRRLAAIEAQQVREQRAAEKAARAAAREQEREDRAVRHALEDERRAAGVCLSCGGPLETGGRGRPPVRCADCRAKAATE